MSSLPQASGTSTSSLPTHFQRMQKATWDRKIPQSYISMAEPPPAQRKKDKPLNLRDKIPYGS